MFGPVDHNILFFCDVGFGVTVLGGLRSCLAEMFLGHHWWLCFFSVTLMCGVPQALILGSILLYLYKTNTPHKKKKKKMLALKKRKKLSFWRLPVWDRPQQCDPYDRFGTSLTSDA